MPSVRPHYMLAGSVVGLLLAAPARAQDAEPSPADPPAEALRVEDGAFVIEGKVQKPQVVVVIRRETLDRGIDLDVKDDFLDEIVRAADEAPF